MMKRKPDYIHSVRRSDGLKQTIALTHHHGRSVKATVVCEPEDTYDREFGEKLADKKLDMRLNVIKRKEVMAETSALLDAKEAYEEALAYINKQIKKNNEYHDTLVGEYDAMAAEYADMVENGPTGEA